MERRAGVTAAPLLAGAAGAAGAAYVALVDPARPGRLPTVPCPFHALTGLSCPGCGMTRAVHDVLTGHPGAALGANALWPVVVMVLAWLWLAWLTPRLPGPTRAPGAVWVTLILIAGAYGIARNLL